MASPRSDDLSSDGDGVLSPSSRDHDLLSSGGKSDLWSCGNQRNCVTSRAGGHQLGSLVVFVRRYETNA